MAQKKQQKYIAIDPNGTRRSEVRREVFNKTNVNRTGAVDVVATVFKQQLSLLRKDINDLRIAIQSAEAIYSPSRLRLYEIYHQIEFDTQVASLLQSRKLKSLGKEFHLVNASDKETAATREATEILKSTWFQQVMGLAWDAIPYGFSLIQLGNIKDNAPEKVTLIPRQNVRPEEAQVLPFPGSPSGVDYSAIPWVLPCGIPNDLGLLAKIARPALFKMYAQSAQAKTVDLFGSPFRYVKMDLSDDELVENTMQMLAEMGNTAYAVLPTEVEFNIEEAKNTGQNPHDLFIKALNEDISKIVFGQTMMSDNGSSRSQSEVHERLANDYTAWDIKFLERTINDNILPRLIQLGFPFSGMRFEFLKGASEEVLFQRASTLLSYKVPVDLKWMEETFGVKMTAETNDATTLTESNGDAATQSPE